MKKQLQGPCQRCGGNIEYLAELVGTMAQCPHCGQSTELMLAVPPEEPPIPKRVVVWTVASLVILVAILAACFGALKWAQHRAQQHPRESPVQSPPP